MTPHNTGAAGFRPGIADRNPPTSKSVDLAGYQPRLAGSVRIMTGFARSALVRLVDMHKMQIEHAVPEISLRIAALVISQCVGMTLEAERVLPFVEWHIKIFRVVLFQKVRKAGAVGRVT